MENNNFENNKYNLENEDYRDFTENTTITGNSVSWNGENLDQGKKKKSKKKIWLNAIAIVCAMSVCLGAGYLGGSMRESQENSEIGTTQESGGSSKDTNSSSSGEYTSLSESSSGSDGKEYSIVEIADMTAKTVVEITTETVVTGSVFQQYVSQGAGSGVIITSDGYIITNHHVIDGAESITVKLKDDTTEYKATLVGTDSKTDIAVIKIDAEDLPCAIFGDSSTLKVGETVVAVGNPLGSLGGTVTDGIISALDREIEIDGETMTLLQTNAAINPGNSGGGLFNTKGELIGIVNAKSSGTDIEGLGFAIPGNTAKSIAEDLINNGYVKGRISLGLTLVDITDTQTAMMYRVQKLGVYILEVEEGGSADSAGLRSGDCIVSADGTEISSYSDFTKVIDSHSIGDTISIVVYRGRSNVECTVTLTEYVPG